MQQSPLVSVLMPVYNGERFVAEAIQSVLNQTYQNFELMVCNDGSNDDTDRVIQSFVDKRIQTLNHSQRLGIPATRNELLNKAKGEFVAWLDADDFSLPQRLQKQVEFLSHNTEFSACFTDVKIVDKKSSKYIQLPNQPLLFKNLLFYKQPFFFSSCMARRYADIGFAPNLKRTQDFGYIWELAHKGSLGIVQQTLTVYKLIDSDAKPDFANGEIESIDTQVKKLEDIGVQFDKVQVVALNKFLRDIRACNKNEANLALALMQKVYLSNELLKQGLNKQYLKAIYVYYVLKSVYFHSIGHLFKLRFAPLQLIITLIRMRM